MFKLKAGKLLNTAPGRESSRNPWIIKLVEFLEGKLTLRAKPAGLRAEFERAVKEEHGGQLPNGFPEEKKQEDQQPKIEASQRSSNSSNKPLGLVLVMEGAIASATL